jgi:hypothetical protein
VESSVEQKNRSWARRISDRRWRVEDTGTPVVEDYNDKKPFAFTGTLKKLVVVLEPDKLMDEEENGYLRRKQRLRWPFNRRIGCALTRKFFFRKSCDH